MKRPALRYSDILAFAGIAGIRPPNSMDGLDITPEMRRAGAIIMSEYQGEVEPGELAEMVYLVMQISRLQEGQSGDSDPAHNVSEYANKDDRQRSQKP